MYIIHIMYTICYVQNIHKHKMEYEGAYLSVKKCKRKFIVSEYT